MSWMSLWYLTSTRKIRDARLKKLFDSLSGVVESDAVFARFILPQLMLQGIVEHNLQVIAECEAEMRAVLQRALLEDGWPRLAAHVIFSITDCLERYAISRSINRIPTDMVLKRTRELLTRVLNERLPDGTLLAVTAAERCHCPARALRWCEQYAINQDGTGRNVFDKSQYYSLQRIYSQLDDLDGILGAFETIKLNSTPTTNECILAFEANGDYSEALPLYQQSREQKIPLIKCMLRLNQPFVALSTAEAMLQAEEDPAILEGIRAAQMEAAWHLHEWSLLDKLVDKYATTSSWGATNASILCSLKHKDEVSMNIRIEGARARLVDSLTAMTIEDSDTYAQAYKYITQLHILDEIEEAKDVLCSFKGEQLTSERLIAVLSKWQKRSACVMQCTGVLEPVFTVRRELLRLTESNLAQTPICELLLHSCRMSRLAGHLQIAWAYLVEAKALNVNQFEVAMEEARFLFEKGNQTQAIGILSNLLDERFSRKVQQLQHVIDEQKKNVNISFAGLREVLRDEPKEEKDNFVKVQLLLADYSLRAGACSFSDLYSKYNALPYVADPSEDLYYRVAIFLDNYLYSKNENLLADKVSLILQAYIRVLTQGRTHLFHVMPRMLTIWLDNAQKREEESSVTTKKPLNLGLPSASRTISNNEKEIGEMNSLMRGAFSRLDHYMFYTAFAQLISRIIHPNEDVFDTLKNILAELLVEYPHQCLWQSIAVYRSDQKKQELRFSRCRTVYEIAKRKDRSGQLKTLIAQYEYAAAAFIKVAEDSYPTGTHSSFSQKYAFLANFFKTGIMDQCVKISSKCESTVSRPLVVVPLREMIEHALPVPIPNSLSQYPVGETPTEKQDTDIGDPSFSNIYIDSIEEQFIVMRSMVRPKKITLVASDGKRYSLMCKAKDELRKDCRLMDINRMVNALLHQNADSRRRQLSVRTYNVVPLQDAGGLIEWIPNLQTYRGVLEPLMTEKCSNVMSDKEWFSNWIPHGTDEQKYERLVTEYFSRHPMVNALLHQNADSRRRQLSVRTYNVVPLQDAGGLIEWIPNLQTYRGVLEPLMTEKCSNVMSDKEWFSNWIPHGTDEQKYERLVTEYFSRHPVVMAEWFRRNFPDPCKWYAARLAFTHTSAVMSMVGFVLGLGDRHGENLLIDVTNGDAIHVDFNLLFNKGELLAVPEVVPFRLTRNIVNGFGVTGVEGAFRRSCESTMRVLRENEAVLLTVLQTFVHDPLLEWVHSEVRAQQLKQRQGGHGVGLKPCSSMAQQQAQEAIEMIRSRLRGNIVSPIIYRNTFDSLPMSVEGQVGKLIQLASDERVLAKMYIGWCPFL
ncbi:Serine/threonine-protein kinase ATR [Toxocara canis]|uniref:Serine/threonine-protein kinase ATR n=1 Tax=Toxocara canis TaxID=6265 RepID=A0A0B2VC07_TOXCA|nr:Serine/threonine-protein kinase ATR [Toxocara canis]